MNAFVGVYYIKGESMIYSSVDRFINIPPKHE